MPQATSEEMGPLELCAHHSPSSAFRSTCLSRLGCGRLPGSHFVPTTRGIDQPAVKATGPAGTVIISDYAILHRRSGSEGCVPCTRNLVKYCYWRTQPPARDWLREDDFDFAAADYNSVDVHEPNPRTWSYLPSPIGATSVSAAR